MVLIVGDYRPFDYCFLISSRKILFNPNLLLEASMKVLIVDDDELMQLTLKSVFKDVEHHIASSVSEAEKLMDRHTFNVAFLDIQLKGEVDGIELLRRIRERDRYLPTVMISGIDQPEIMSKCLELGAVDYVVKGSVNPEAYKFAVYKAAAWRKLLSESVSSRSAATSIGTAAIEDIKGDSEVVKELKAQLNRLGKLPGPFLIMGETGTGKELVARALWGAMCDRNRPFIAVNCASLPENLVESELFGYEKGAFTGAQQTKTGLFEAANGGDLFLDEIGELNIELQAKLLRVLQEKTVRRLGSDKERPVSVRVIAATHVDIPNAVDENAFREDLFYRLNVHTIQLPPLRERGSDITRLLLSYLSHVGYRNLKLDPQAETKLLNYRWPGNVRQLRAFAEYLRGHLDHVTPVVTDQMVDKWLTMNRPRGAAAITAAAAAAAAASQQSGIALATGNASQEVQKALSENKTIPIVDMLDGLQKAYVEAAMQAAGSNRSKAARVLGVSRQRLCNWLSQWGLG